MDLQDLHQQQSSRLHSKREIDIVQQYLADSIVVKIQANKKIQQNPIVLVQTTKLIPDCSQIIEPYLKIQQICSYTNLSPTQKQLKNPKRTKDHNSCKKVNLYAFNCLNSLSPSKNLKPIKKSIHRVDFFVALLLIAQRFNVEQKFLQSYLNLQSSEKKKLIQQMEREEVKQFFKKTLQAIKIFKVGNLQQTICVLFNVNKLKCRTYLEQSKMKIKQLQEIVNEKNLNEIYVKRRIVRKKINK